MKGEEKNEEAKTQNKKTDVIKVATMARGSRGGEGRGTTV